MSSTGVQKFKFAEQQTITTSPAAMSAEELMSRLSDNSTSRAPTIDAGLAYLTFHYHVKEGEALGNTLVFAQCVMPNGDTTTWSRQVSHKETLGCEELPTPTPGESWAGKPMTVILAAQFAEIGELEAAQAAWISYKETRTEVGPKGSKKKVSFGRHVVSFLGRPGGYAPVRLQVGINDEEGQRDTLTFRTARPNAPAIDTGNIPVRSDADLA